ncbi:DrmB family protein [Capnocytophaga canimorsus]|uniref:DrmB family protein n=1 Tax=Capnocytophaga canimorsus TaxID=28188 RepID=UPI0037D6FCE6
MGQFEQIQTRKAISSYGGVGSIVETRDGSILIENFDKWPFFEAINGQFEEHNLIIDKRFKNRLSKYFQELEHLVKIPVNELKQGYKPENQFAFLSAKYFPEWFYCNNCNRFDRLDNWKNNWENNVEKEHRNNFFPPKCFHCYVKNRDKNRKFFDLEQVRFILTSPNGEIADIPWDKWAMLKNIKKNDKKEPKETTSEEDTITLANVQVPDDVVFEYKTSDKLDDLKGIWIIVKRKNGEQINFTTLSGLFNLRIKIQDLIPNTKEKDIWFKPVIRSSNSVYYPNILSSIFIPANDELNEYSIRLIEEEHKDGSNAQIISRNLKRYRNIEIEPAIIQNLIDNNFSEREIEIAKTENQYRYDEYKFITEKDSFHSEDNLIFNKIDKSLFQGDLIKSIYRMDKIKIISVQPSYTRQEPISLNSILQDEDAEKTTKKSIVKKFTSSYGKKTKYLPAIESFGEGIFFEFDNNVLNKWVQSNLKIQERVSILISNKQQFESALSKDFELNAKYVLTHTFSHLIIKELEYLCGYPSTSIQERLYIDEELGMNGVLIYTIAGSEGSYGGITSICDDDKIGKLIESAMIRATDCATDPICYHTHGQGVANLNLSACFSCTLLPETSCEKFNCYLDRRILVDEEYGYFKNLIFNSHKINS